MLVTGVVEEFFVLAARRDQVLGNLVGEMLAGLSMPLDIATDIGTETAAIFATGHLPERALTRGHFDAALRLYFAGTISAAELASFSLLLHLATETNKSPTGLWQSRGRAPWPFALTDAQVGALPPLLRRLCAERLGRVKGVAHAALVGWQLGLYPGVLAFGAVSTMELLAAQARGRRYVGVHLPDALRVAGDGEDHHYVGGFTCHDLCHLTKFMDPRGDPTLDDTWGRDYFYGQVGFFDALYELYREQPELVAETEKTTAQGLRLDLVATDMNGDVRFLWASFLARMLARAEARGPQQDLEVLVSTMGHFGLGAHTELAPLFFGQRAEFLQRTAPLFVARGRERAQGDRH